MGAVVVYGDEFFSEELNQGGRTYIYLRAVNGGSFELSYSSFEDLKEVCERFGATDDDWPDYIDLGGYDIPEDEMIERNRRLAALLADLTSEETSGTRRLKEIVEILRQGQHFYVH